MKRFPLVVAAVLFLAAPAVAQQGVKWTGTIEKACVQAKERGSLIFVGMVIDNEVSNDTQKTAYHDPEFVRESRGFVCVYANPHLMHGTQKVTIDGKERDYCRDTLCTQCSDHLRAWNETLRNFSDNEAQNGDRKIPFNFVIRPDMKVVRLIVNGTVDGGFDFVAGAEMANILRQISSQHGRGLTDKEYVQAKKDLAEGEKLHKAGDFKKALPHLTAVTGANDRSSLAERAKALIDQVVALAEGQMTDAIGKAKDDPLGAVMALEALATEYKGTKIEKNAKAKIAELKRKPEVRKVMSQIAAQKKALGLIEKAEECVEKKDYAKALSKLDDIAKKYAGSPAGDMAKARAEELRSDEAIVKAAYEQKAAKVCKGWLSMGRSYARNGMQDRAKAQFQKIIDKFPGTSYADLAKKELEKLK